MPPFVVALLLAGHGRVRVSTSRVVMARLSRAVPAVVLASIIGAALAGCAQQPSPGTASIVTPAELAASLDALRAATLAPGALAVAVDGGARTAAASGTRSLRGATVEPTDRFRIGSITKTVVAALVLISVERGELGLDDVATDRLPGVLRATPAVTVRQLLGHTSGVFDELNEGDVTADIARLPDAASRAEAEDFLRRHAAGERVVASPELLIALAETHERYFAPGAGYHYSNTNYQVLGRLLEAATGQRLPELLRTRIVEPLGLTATTWAPADTASPDLRGYDSTATGAMVDVTDDLAAYGNGANGGIVSSADDLVAMLRAITAARLFGADLVAEMERPARGTYGLGIATYSFSCGTYYGHGGSVSGTQSIAVVSGDGSRGAVAAISMVSGGDVKLPALAEAAVCGASR